jgi:hypothetical protein
MTGHQCLCVLVYSDGAPNRCAVVDLPADAPFCGNCESRHPECPPRMVTHVDLEGVRP